MRHFSNLEYLEKLTDTRRKSIELLQDALTFEPDDKNAVRLAMEIEGAVFEDCGSDDKHYKVTLFSLPFIVLKIYIISVSIIS